MCEWYSPNELPQPNVILLAYYDNSPYLMYIEKDGTWYFAWTHEQARNSPDCWRYIPPRPRTINATP